MMPFGFAVVPDVYITVDTPSFSVVFNRFSSMFRGTFLPIDKNSFHVWDGKASEYISGSGVTDKTPELHRS